MIKVEQKREYYYKSKLGIVRDAEIEDVFELAPNLRPKDKREIWKSHHKTAENALMEGLLNSEICFTMERNEKPIVMFGIVPQSLLSNSATIWLLASPEIERIQVAFLKHSRYFIDLMLQHYPYLDNYVDAENKKSIEWLKFCGATLEEPKPYGIEKALFRYFYFRRS